MEALIQMRRGTAAQWISANPVLADGEPGFETDTGKGKVGAGGVHWNSLGYAFALSPQGPAGGSLTGSYPNPGLAANSVGAVQIADGTVGSAELAAGAVGTTKIAANAVGAGQLADGAVVLAKLAPNSVDSTKIVDGSIGVADLSSAAQTALSVAVADEGTVVVSPASQINFTGAGVTAALGAAGVATVTIPGGTPGTTIPAGTIAWWYSSTPPSGWYLCDGSVHTDLAGTLGTLFGATSGTVPNIGPQVQDSFVSNIGTVIASSNPGWACDSVNARIQQGMIQIQIQYHRSGGTISLGTSNPADQQVGTVTPNYSPGWRVGGGCLDAVRHWVLTNAGVLSLTAGIASGSGFNSGNIVNGDVFTMTATYPVNTGVSTLPKVYPIIKAP